MKAKILQITLGILLAIGLASCSPGDEAAPTVEGLIEGELIVVSSSAFTDTWGWYHVVGEVVNNSNQALTSMELTIEVRDESGNSLLKDDNGNPAESDSLSPMLYTLAAGQYTPFDYSFDPAGSIPATYQIQVSSYLPGEANRAEIVVENTEMINDSSGTFYLSGELVNQSNQWAEIHSLAGAGLDANNQVMTADWSGTYTMMLAPAGDGNRRDRTPFSIQFPVPGMIEVTQWSVYVDADLDDAPSEYALQRDVTNNYIDEWGSFHIVGNLTNGSNDALHTLLVGGVYAEDGTTLDATWSFLPVIIEPGATIPFDISSFSSVNWNEKQASRISRYTIQFDPWATYPSTWETVTLNTSNDQIRMDGATWKFSGEVVNFSGWELSGETVIVALYDAQGILVASTYTYISPEGESIANGQTNSYEVSLYIDPTADTTGYTYRTFAQGDVK